MTRKLFVLFILLSAALTGFGQGENNIWTFSDRHGLDFNGGSPVYYRDSIRAYEGCASVCDHMGNLLFYSNGHCVLNRDHDTMPNGGGLVGHLRSSSQGVGIAKIPGYTDLYYLFVVEGREFKKGRIRYSQIDMSLDGGRGDIVPGKKDILLDSFMGEKVAFAGLCDNPWLITHHQDSAKFYAYKLNSASTIAAPVVSYSGAFNGAFIYSLGEMKVAPNSNRIALVRAGDPLSIPSKPNALELYDFDESTGLVSNPMVIDTNRVSGYGIEFSPDMSKLFTASPLNQYDLSLPTIKDIMDSKVMLSAKVGYTTLRIGPDKKVYFCGSIGSFFCRIDFPNLYDTPSRVQEPFIPDPPVFGVYGMGIGLNAYIPRNKAGDTVFNVSVKNLCEEDTVRIKGYGYKYYNWSDGDTSSSKILYKPGKVWLVSRINCIVNIDTYIIKEVPLTVVPRLAKDTLVCSGKSVSLSSDAGRDWYLWSDGDKSMVRSFKPPAGIWCSSKKKCTLFIDTFIVREEKPVYTISRKDTSVCPLDRITLHGKPLADDYTWFDGSDKDSNTFLAIGGTYWVQSQTACTIAVDTFRVIERPEKILQTAQLVRMCDGERRLVTDHLPFDIRVWSTGDTGRSIDIREPGRYWVRRAKDCNLYVDTFNAVLMTSSTAHLSTDTPACLRASLMLSADDSFHRFNWSGGSTQRDTTLYHSARVFVVATDTIRCRILKHNFNVVFVAYERGLRDTFVCNEDTLYVDASIPDTLASYEWNTGERSASIKMNKPGTRYVSIRTQGCTIRDSIKVGKVDLPLSFGGDQVHCNGDKVILKADVSDVTYKWSTGATGQEIEVSESGRYRLTVVNGDCTVTTEADIRFVPCSNCLKIPNAFTPNTDGINDRFKPIFNCPVLSYELSVRNRWGQVLFTTANPNEGWDGISAGLPLEGNVYYYMLKVKFDAQGNEEQLYKGDVTLIR